ncbi:MAG: aminotransferase class I/II-fold pyridoxal phosphate-dependent enzyme [Desulfosarcinaceae bacterium]|nr:aminotransferase class I/II-fold pyridoxal phosphate-dependent enzyme [Desulfosarcinaceae bacterium]
MTLTAKRMLLLGSENAFKVGDDIRRAEALGTSVIKLNLGEPDFDSAPNINQAACQAIAAGDAHYCDPQGLLSLRRSIAASVFKSRGVRVDPDQVVVTCGGKPPIGYSVLTYVDPGDEVIYPNPGFPIYESWIKFVEAIPRPMMLKEERSFRLDLDDLAPLISENTKLIILNSPSNPTGGVLTKDDLVAIATLLKERAHPQFRILSDEVYEKILFDGRRHESILSLPEMRAHTILLNSHSKTYAMTGWRVGYAVLPSVEEAQIFRQWNINTYSCVPPFIQRAAQQAIDDAQNDEIVSKMTAEFERRRDRVIDALNEIPGVRCVKPAGAFYAFPNIAGVIRHLDIMERYEALLRPGCQPVDPSTMFQLFALYRHGVATLDRAAFGINGSFGQHYLRISLASDTATLMTGVRRLAAAAVDREGWLRFAREESQLLIAHGPTGGR